MSHPSGAAPTVASSEPSRAGSDKARPPLLRAYQTIAQAHIGILPLPAYLLLLAVILGFLGLHDVPSELCVIIALLLVGGFTCAEIGHRIPVVKRFGAAAIIATFLPSALVFYKVLPPLVVERVTDFADSTRFIYLYVSCIVVGSVLSMNRAALVRGFVRIFVPLAAGTLVAGAVGVALGELTGVGARRALYFIVVPIMGGGVGEGAIPLSIGYAGILHEEQGRLLAQILPSVMFGSLTAVLLSGALSALGRLKPHLTGNGELQKGVTEDVPDLQDAGTPFVADVAQVASAGATAIALYVLGLLGHEATGFPAPLTMLFAAVALKALGAIPLHLEAGSRILYRFFASAVTYPLLFAVGVAMTPWDELLAALQPANLVVIVGTVAALMTTGFFVGRWVGLYPIEAAIVNGCHSGQGGTGDVAILTAAGRMQLMPFAQIATRIGGACVVTAALFTLKFVGV